ncbi:MAG: hypothetical protein R2780_07090, partial [Crocinitomicaceae bacterium]
MSNKLQSAYFSAYKYVVKLLPPGLKKRFWSVQVLIIFTSFIDLIGLAIFIPLLAAVADGSMIDEMAFLREIKAFTDVEDNSVFLLLLFGFALGFFFLRTLFILFSNWIQFKFIYDLKDAISTAT